MLFIWIGIGAGISIFSTLVALIRFRERQRKLSLPTIYLARHCKTAWNSEGRVQGTRDIELSPAGAHDAELNLPAIRGLGIEQIVCSNAKRAMQTATIYAQRLGVPLQSSSRFVELDHGEWEGQRIEYLLSLSNSSYKRWVADPGTVLIPGSSETARMAQQRILEGVREICSTYGGKTVLVVGHKHILALLSCSLKKCPFTEFRKEIVESTLPYQVSIERCAFRCSRVASSSHIRSEREGQIGGVGCRPAVTPPIFPDARAGRLASVIRFLCRFLDGPTH